MKRSISGYTKHVGLGLPDDPKKERFFATMKLCIIHFKQMALSSVFLELQWIIIWNNAQSVK